MDETSVQEYRCEKTPVFVLHDDRVRIERADPMQNFRVVPIAHGHLEKKRNRVQQNKDENSRRASELAMTSGTRSFVPDRD